MEQHTLNIIPFTPLILLSTSLVISLFTYTNDDFAKLWSVGSNVAYISPSIIAFMYIKAKKGVNLTPKQFFYIYQACFFIIMSLISSMYHLCSAYNQCILLTLNDWGHIDTLFSWLLLLTLITYVIFKNRAPTLILLINVVVVVITRESHCSSENYDCQNYRIYYIAFLVIFGFIFNIILGKRFRDSKEFTFNFLDLGLGIVFFIIATIFYFAHYLPAHTMWHTFGAVGSSVALTVYEDAPIHYLGINKCFTRKNLIKNTENIDERTPFLKENRADLRHYRYTKK